MIRNDIIQAMQGQEEARDRLADQHIAMTGGTGFLGSWVAETVALLNDEYRLGITLTLYARHVTGWQNRHAHLAARSDIRTYSQDVRSPFEFSPDTTLVLHAAGIPDNRAHASDPLRVFDTTVQGMRHVLDAASKLTRLVCIAQLSSGLVNAPQAGLIKETDQATIDTGKPHLVYADAKRAAESLCAIYRSQQRLPIVTLRPFTFIGPYQELDRPWAVNNFLRDALTGNDIRLHGDGGTRRSYLYGSDAAWWSLNALVRGEDGKCYNLGSDEPVTHRELAERIARHVSPAPAITLRTLPAMQAQHHDFLPDVTRITHALGLRVTCPLDTAIRNSLAWHGQRLKA